MSVGFTLDMRDLFAALGQLDAKVAKGGAQSANRKAAAFLAKQMVSVAPNGPKAEGAIQRRKRRNGVVRIEKHVKIRNNLKAKKGKADNLTAVKNIITTGKAYHVAFVEFGSIHNAPNPFIRRTMETQGPAALDIMKTELAKQIIKRGGSI